MAEDNSFRDPLERVLADDARPWTELVRGYKPYLQAVVRVRSWAARFGA